MAKRDKFNGFVVEDNCDMVDAIEARFNPDTLKYEIVNDADGKPKKVKAPADQFKKKNPDRKKKLEEMAAKVTANMKTLKSSDAGRLFRLNTCAVSDEGVVGSAAKTWMVGINDLETLLEETHKVALKDYFTLGVASGKSLADLSKTILMVFALTELADGMFMPEVPKPNKMGNIEHPDSKMLMIAFKIDECYPKGFPAGVNTPTKAVKMVMDKINDYKTYSQHLISFTKDPKPYEELLDVMDGMKK